MKSPLRLSDIQRLIDSRGGLIEFSRSKYDISTGGAYAHLRPKVNPFVLQQTRKLAYVSDSIAHQSLHIYLQILLEVPFIILRLQVTRSFVTQCGVSYWICISHQRIRERGMRKNWTSRSNGGNDGRSSGGEQTDRRMLSSVRFRNTTRGSGYLRAWRLHSGSLLLKPRVNARTRAEVIHCDWSLPIGSNSHVYDGQYIDRQKHRRMSNLRLSRDSAILA